MCGGDEPDRDRARDVDRVHDRDVDRVHDLDRVHDRDVELWTISGNFRLWSDSVFGLYLDFAVCS